MYLGMLEVVVAGTLEVSEVLSSIATSGHLHEYFSFPASVPVGLGESPVGISDFPLPPVIPMYCIDYEERAGSVVVAVSAYICAGGALYLCRMSITLE